MDLNQQERLRLQNNLQNILIEEFNNESKTGIGKFISSDQETIFKLYFYDLDDYCLTISQEI